MSGAPWKTDIQVSGLKVKLKCQNYVEKHWGNKTNTESFFALGNYWVQEVDVLLSPKHMLIIHGETP